MKMPRKAIDYCKGDRTEEARAALRGYVRERDGITRRVPNLDGGTTRVDTARLRSIIDTDGRPQYRIALDCGMDQSAIAKVLSRGTCKVSTLDKLAAALGVMDTDIEAVA